MTLSDTDVTKKELKEIARVDTIEEYEALDRTKDKKIDDMIWFYIMRKDEEKATIEMHKLSPRFFQNAWPEGLSQMFDPPGFVPVKE